MKLMERQGFTLLEIIIVIIIVGVLASLALPKFFRTVEYARSTEALTSISAIRQSVERCYLMRGGTYVGCTLANLDLEDPTDSPNAHFSYILLTPGGGVDFMITAMRTSRDGGTVGDVVNLRQVGGTILRFGTGAFSGIQ